MGHRALFVAVLSLLFIAVLSELTTDSSFTSTKSQTSTTEKVTTTVPETTFSETTSSTVSSTTSTPSKSSSTTTELPPPQSFTEWQDMEDLESEKLVNFVVSEIQKLKVEHKELDECQELELSSVLSGKKLAGKVTKYSITLKVQPQIKNTEGCLQQNSTMANLHPEICEADVTEGDHGGSDDKTLLRSTCLQVEELQD
ncbi:TBC1 domain family member 5 homolog B-like [Uloborus diversus]|uniref:TBC1 domain family member 5 homolog B-like n=1 Tax=Uloborus diversus TaxID=327109 RepID=UPI002409929F|nr:TBC1 domain family member 5 homolog B-like [Uloborus diversus]